MAFDPKDDDKNKPALPVRKEPERDPDAKPRAAEDLRSELTEKEMADLSRKAAENVQVELLKKKREDFMAAEMERLRQEYGISRKSLGGVHDETVNITIDLGDYEEGKADPFLCLDIPGGKKYEHGRTYPVPRHVAACLNEMMFRLHLHNRQKDGKSVYRNRKYGSVIGETGIRHTGRPDARVA